MAWNQLIALAIVRLQVPVGERERDRKREREGGRRGNGVERGPVS